MFVLWIIVREVFQSAISEPDILNDLDFSEKGGIVDPITEIQEIESLDQNFLINIIYFNLTSQYYKWMKSFLSLLSERREMRDSKKNAVPGLGVGSNPGHLAPESCVLPCAPLHFHKVKTFS